MYGVCENCAKNNRCKADIGIIWGFCNTDFEPVAKFEVGKSYEAAEVGYDPILIEKRTDKTVWVKAGNVRWSMRVRHDDDGNEYVKDSSAPQSWQFLHVYNAKWEVRAEA